MEYLEMKMIPKNVEKYMLLAEIEFFLSPPEI